MSEAAAHLYLHIPYCISKCRYCAFFSQPGAGAAELDGLVSALLTELGLRYRAGEGGQPWRTIYLGGGTPSLLGPRRVARLLAGISEVAPPAADAEVTLEANPESLAPGDPAAYRQAGINRISIGLQSLSDPALRFLGRAHDAAHGRAAVADARDAGLRLSVDLIYGLPGQSESHWRQELAEVATLSPEHLSAYELSYEPGTPLHASPGPPKRRSDKLFFVTHEQLATLGFEGYEVSSFARNAQARSRHNLATWHHRPYLGLGPGSHTFLADRRGWLRRWNRADTAGYRAALAAGHLPPAEEEWLTPAQLALERLMLGLRTTAGVDLAACRTELGIDLAVGREERVANLAASGLLRLDHDRWRPTLAGLALADRLAVDL